MLYLQNSVFVTGVATLITLLTNSMAAFALSKYEFRGRSAVMMVILATLMIPLSVILVPLYSIVSGVGLFNSLWGVILPTVATPTGVFLLRQYMLTIPDELLEAARMDAARAGSVKTRKASAAMRSASPIGTRRADTPSSTMSGMPPAGVETTGTPLASDSRIEMGMLSTVLGLSMQSAEA